jgi:hypothetical protein
MTPVQIDIPKGGGVVYRWLEARKARRKRRRPGEPELRAQRVWYDRKHAAAAPGLMVTFDTVHVDSAMAFPFTTNPQPDVELGRMRLSSAAERPTGCCALQEWPAGRSSGRRQPGGRAVDFLCGIQ